MVRAGQANMQQAREAQRIILAAAVPPVPLELAALDNETARGAFEQTVPVPIEMTDPEKTEHGLEWKACQHRNSKLIDHRGQACSLVLGQCTQLLKDKMKQDTDWATVSASCDPSELCRLIEKTVSAQMEDQHPFATVCDQEVAFCSFRQDPQSNPQCCEQSNTRVDVSTSVGATRQHKASLEHVAKEGFSQACDALGDADKETVRNDAEERHISHVFLKQSGKQHASVRVDLKNDHTTGDDRHPKTRQNTLHLLDMHSKLCINQVRPKELHLHNSRSRAAAATLKETTRCPATLTSGKTRNAFIAMRRDIRQSIVRKDFRKAVSTFVNCALGDLFVLAARETGLFPTHAQHFDELKRTILDSPDKHFQAVHGLLCNVNSQPNVLMVHQRAKAKLHIDHGTGARGTSSRIAIKKGFIEKNHHQMLAVCQRVVTCHKSLCLALEPREDRVLLPALLVQESVMVLDHGGCAVIDTGLTPDKFLNFVDATWLQRQVSECINTHPVCFQECSKSQIRAE